MPDEFPYDVFLSHSSKDKTVVRPLAARLRADGDTSKGEGKRMKCEIHLLPSAFILHPFPNVPLNKERRFLPLRLDEAPIKDSDWFRKDEDLRWQPSGAGQIAKGNPQVERGGVHQFGVPPKGNANFAWVQHFTTSRQVEPALPGAWPASFSPMAAWRPISPAGDIRRAGRNFRPGRT